MRTIVSGAILLMAVVLLPAQARPEKVTARQVIAKMQKNLTCPWNKETVDTFKSGNPDDAVTGGGHLHVCQHGNP